MKLMTLAALTVGVLPTLTAILTGSPAIAADCMSDRLCLYTDPDFKGNVGSYPLPARGTCVNLEKPINNNAESMKNYLSADILLFDMPGCGGTLTYLARSFRRDLDFADNRFSNKASSFRRP